VKGTTGQGVHKVPRKIVRGGKWRGKGRRGVWKGLTYLLRISLEEMNSNSKALGNCQLETLQLAGIMGEEDMGVCSRQEDADSGERGKESTAFRWKAGKEKSYLTSTAEQVLNLSYLSLGRRAEKEGGREGFRQMEWKGRR